jgi:hypothetical protein
MDNLLELVNDCTVLTVEDNKEVEKLEEVINLRKLGFKKIADEMENDLLHKVKLKKISDLGYIEITDDAVKKFLKRKVENYNKKHQKKTKPRDGAEIRIERIDPRSWNPRSWEVPIIEPISQNPGDPSVSNREQLIWSNEQMGDLVRHHRERSGEFIEDSYGAPYGMQIQQIEPYPNSTYESMRAYRAQLAAQIQNNFADSFGRQMEGFFAHVSSHQNRNVLSEKTCDFYSNEDGKIGQYLWTEIKLEDYKTIPPKEVLSRLKEEQEKQIFDYYTIASVNAIKDPVLFGRVNNYPGRFYILNWDLDICLDDLI